MRSEFLWHRKWPLIVSRRAMHIGWEGPFKGNLGCFPLYETDRSRTTRADRWIMERDFPIAATDRMECWFSPAHSPIEFLKPSWRTCIYTLSNTLSVNVRIYLPTSAASYRYWAELWSRRKPDLRQRAVRFHQSPAFVAIQNVQLL